MGLDRAIHAVSAAAGRRRKTSLHSMMDTIFYLLKSGCQWTLLSHDFQRVRCIAISSGSAGTRPGGVFMTRSIGGHSNWRAVTNSHRFPFAPETHPLTHRDRLPTPHSLRLAQNPPAQSHHSDGHAGVFTRLLPKAVIHSGGTNIPLFSERLYSLS